MNLLNFIFSPSLEIIDFISSDTSLITSDSSFSNNLEHQLNLEKKYQIMAAETEDFNEGVNAFLEKRKPNFKGK